MGNTIVMPSFQDWYTEPLRKKGYRIVNQYDSGTFFLVFEATNNQGQEFIVKAYEYDRPIPEIPQFPLSMKYFDFISENSQSIIGVFPYSDVFYNNNSVFLIRPKKSRSLLNAIQFQQPKLFDIEKKWILYQCARHILSLNFLKMYHGDLKPSNIFVDDDLQVFIADLAPFKPHMIRSDMPQIFHHFFTTPTDNHCCLAPERLATIDEGFNKEALVTADLFSLGCIFAYVLRNGKHLFDFHSLKSFKEGNYDIKPMLDEIEDPKLRDLTTKLLSFDPSVRENSAFELDSYFPSIFQDYFLVAYSSFDLNKIIKISHNYSQKGLNLLVLNSILEALRTFKTQADILASIDEICTISTDIPDIVKLERILPSFLELLDLDSIVVFRRVLDSIVEISKSILNLPPELNNIYNDIIIKRIQNSPNANKIEGKFAIAYFAPQIAVELMRLSPKTNERLPSLIVFIAQSNDSDYIDAFCRSYCNCSVNGGYGLFMAFYKFLLTLFNIPNPKVHSAIFKIFQNSIENCALSDYSKFRSLFISSVAPISIDIALKQPSVDSPTYVAWICKKGFVHRSFIPEIARCASDILLSSCDEEISASARLLLRIMPQEYIPDSLITPESRQFTMPPVTPPFELLGFDQEKVTTPRPIFMGNFRLGRSSVSHLVWANPQTIIASHSRNILSWISYSKDTPYDVVIAKKVRDSISTMSIVGSSLAVGFKSGAVEILDSSNGRRISSLPTCDPLKVIEGLGDSSLLVAGDRCLSLYDIRASGSQCHVELSDQVLSAAAMGGPAFVVGTANSFASVFDSRVLRVVAADPTTMPRIVCGCPSYPWVAGVSDLSNLVVHSFDMVGPLSNTHTAPAAIVPYEDGIIGVTEAGAVMVSLPTGRTLLLGDRSTSEIRNGEVFQRAPPVHMHSAPVTAAANNGGIVASGDLAGFVSFWGYI